MGRALDYLVALHYRAGFKIGKDDYTDENGVTLNCGEVALTLAQLCSNDGKKPSILQFYEHVPPRIGMLRRLDTGLYQWKTAWGIYFVCACDGFAYEPVIGTPVPIGEYSLHMFGREVPKEEISSEETHAILQRRNQKPAR
jgi:hypothetical protein